MCRVHQSWVLPVGLLFQSATTPILPSKQERHHQCQICLAELMEPSQAVQTEDSHLTKWPRERRYFERCLAAAAAGTASGEPAEGISVAIHEISDSTQEGEASAISQRC